MKSRPINRAAKGARLEALAKAWLEAEGYAVEMCPNQVIWIPNKKAPPRMIHGRAVYPLVPIAVRRDFWGCFDGIAVNDFERFFFQVTVWSEVGHKRFQLAKCPFQPLLQDRILAYSNEGSPSRHFKVLNAPDFIWQGKCLLPPKASPTEAF